MFLNSAPHHNITISSQPYPAFTVPHIHIGVATSLPHAHVNITISPTSPAHIYIKATTSHSHQHLSITTSHSLQRHNITASHSHHPKFIFTPQHLYLASHKLYALVQGYLFSVPGILHARDCCHISYVNINKAVGWGGAG